MSKIFAFLQDFDMTKLLPAPDKYLRTLEGWTRVGLLLCPLILLGLGILFRDYPPQNAEKRLCIRTRWSVSSQKAWQMTHRLAATRFIIVGGIMAAAVLLISLFFRLMGTLVMMNVALLLVIAELVTVLVVIRNIGKEVKDKSK